MGFAFLDLFYPLSFRLHPFHMTRRDALAKLGKTSLALFFANSFLARRWDGR